MSTRAELSVWHKQVYGSRPAFFISRYTSDCYWCLTPIRPGDESCYWPEADMDVAHEGCLWALWKSDK